MDEFYTRAVIVKERIERLNNEAKRIAKNPTPAVVERLTAIKVETDLLLANMYEIRAEQLEAQLPKPKAEKRRWWRRMAV